jgi:hypothetical protein
LDEIPIYRYFFGTFLKAQEVRQAVNSSKQTKIMLVQILRLRGDV